MGDGRPRPALGRSEENVAENKYDTLGLEAAYLVTGQARRAEAIRQAMANSRAECEHEAPQVLDGQRAQSSGKGRA